MQRTLLVFVEVHDAGYRAHVSHHGSVPACSHPYLCPCLHAVYLQLVEVVMDLGRPPAARWPEREELLSSQPITAQDLEYAVQQVW